MHADSYFTIGKTHKVCQDYARVTDSETVSTSKPFVLAVSDGCSGSPHTDFGSRFLVQSTLLKAISSYDNKDFAARVLTSARLMCIAAELPEECLDATLLTGIVVDDKLHVTVVGDGVVTAKHKDGYTEVWSIDFSDEAPAYLSYTANPDRLEQYIKADYGFRTTKRYRNIKGEWDLEDTEADRVSVVNDIAVNFAVRLNFKLDDYDMIALFTDGVRSFSTKSTGDKKSTDVKKTPDIVPIPFLAVIDEILDIKSTAGEFMNRSCNWFFNKFCHEHGWVNADDFAVAAWIK